MPETHSGRHCRRTNCSPAVLASLVLEQVVAIPLLEDSVSSLTPCSTLPSLSTFKRDKLGNMNDRRWKVHSSGQRVSAGGGAVVDAQL